MSKPDKTASHQTQQMLIVGIDWADQKHDLYLIDSCGHGSHEKLKHDPEEITAWVAKFHKRFPKHKILIAIEQSRGGLFHALLEFEGLQLYPINPKQLARYREAICPAGSKGDPEDAKLLARFLLHHHEQLRIWQADTPETRRIAHLAPLRRKLVDERKRQSLKLRSTLKLYFPLIITLFGKKLTSPLVLDLIVRWPSLEQLKRPHPKTLRKFFAEHGIRDKDKQTELINAIRSATPLSRDKTLIEPHATYAAVLARQIRELNQGVQQFDTDLEEAVAKHPDAKLFQGLPGAGDVLVPRLIAAMGTDRDRYKSAQELQAATGIAPVTRRSGKSCHVSKRYACSKFLRQTFHEFADQARKWSTWSKAFYKMKRESGMKHHAALRALAFKWIRIIFRLWKNGGTYCEHTYLENLRAKHSPIIQFIETKRNDQY